MTGQLGGSPAFHNQPLSGGSLGADIFGRLRSARTVTLIEVQVCEGDGTATNAMRTVTYWYTPDGEFVAKRDPRDEGPRA